MATPGSRFASTDAAWDPLVAATAADAGPYSAFAVAIDRLATVRTVLGYENRARFVEATGQRIEHWAGARGRVALQRDLNFLAVRTDLPDAATALAAAERLRAELAEPVEVDGLHISRSASIGIAHDPSASTDVTRLESLLRLAIQTCADVRASDGDDSRLGVPDPGQRPRMRLELELYEALEHRELLLHYQPEYDLRTGRIHAVEALLRWNHPQRGLIGPDAFLPEAEQTHTFAAVEAWVVDEACRQLFDWCRAGLGDGLVARVNVAPMHVPRGRFTECLSEALDRYSLSGNQVCVELTERRMPAELDALVAQLQDWRAWGVRVAVDDFGTGAATLTHLIDLPVDVVKLDQQFVRRMLRDERATAIARAVVSVSHALGLDVVAEGVSSPETAARLIELGCTRGQGNSLAEAMPADRLADLLRAQLGT